MLLLFAFLCNHPYAMSFVQEALASDFNDLGKLLFGGFILAIGVAIAFTLVKLRLRDKKPPSNNFISIASPPKKGVKANYPIVARRGKTTNIWIATRTYRPNHEK